MHALSLLCNPRRTPSYDVVAIFAFTFAFEGAHFLPRGAHSIFALKEADSIPQGAQSIIVLEGANSLHPRRNKNLKELIPFFFPRREN